jgi:hypothetical protein
MIDAGKKFLDIMNERGGVLLDTEIVLGDPEEQITGQPDKVWLMENKEKLNLLADILIEKEVIFKDDLETIFGKRPFDPIILEETTE